MKNIEMMKVSDMFSEDSVKEYVSECAIIPAEAMTGRDEGCFVDVPTPLPSLFYF